MSSQSGRGNISKDQAYGEVEIDSRPFGIFRREISTYQANLDHLLATSLGMWVAIRGEEMFGTYEKLSVALEDAYNRCGLDKPFFIWRVGENFSLPVTGD